MSLDLKQVQGGMPVYSSGGEEIGNVAGVAAAPNIIGGVAEPGDLAPAEPPTRYLQVDRRGILGIASRALYVPESAIEHLEMGRGVTLNCTRDECFERYSRKPNIP